MGFNRFLKKSFIPFYNGADMVKKVRKHGFVKGVKEKFREDIFEDAPVTSHIYNVGRSKGKEDGYNKASNEYADKLFKQAEMFINQKEVAADQIKQYRDLLDAYEQYIKDLAEKDSLTPSEKTTLNQVMLTERQLIRLKN